jgi:hypothetical protein
VAVRKAIAGRDALVAQGGFLEVERLGRRTELQIRRAVEPRADVLQILLDVPECERQAAILGHRAGRALRYMTRYRPAAPATTSTPYFRTTLIDDPRHGRTLAGAPGGTAGGITDIHEWLFVETSSGVHVETNESFAGDPVEADGTSMQSMLDASLGAWLGHLKAAAESSV